jgi:hypothetical protein
MPANLPKTCGACQAGWGQRFVIGPVQLDLVTTLIRRHPRHDRGEQVMHMNLNFRIALLPQVGKPIPAAE